MSIKKLECLNPKCPFEKYYLSISKSMRRQRNANIFFKDGSKYRKYTKSEIAEILDHKIVDREIARKLHRSLMAIVNKRYLYKKKLLEA